MKKYKVGKRIKSLKELSKCDFIYYNLTSIHSKIIDKGWWQNWSIRLINVYISRGIIFKAVPQKWYKKELRARKKVVDSLIEIPNELPFLGVYYEM